MLINVGSKKNPHFQLVISTFGRYEVDYKFFDLMDPYWGPCSTTIKGNAKIRVIDGETKINAIKIVRESCYQHLHDAQDNVDIINLIQSMTKDNQ